MDEPLKAKIDRAANNYKDNIRRIVNDHLTSKYATCTRVLGELDNGDVNQAKLIAKKQIRRANKRISNEQVDALIDVVHTDACIRATEAPFQFARGRHQAKPSSGGATADPVPVANRFDALSNNDNEIESDDEEIDDINEICNANMTAEIILDTQSGKNKRRAQTPPSMEAAKGKKTALLRAPDQDTAENFATPVGMARGKGAPRTGSDHPGPNTITLEVDVHNPVDTPNSTPLPSPVPAPPHAQRTHRHLSVFDSSKRSVWELPEIFDGEDTLLLADSNGVALSRHTPPSWRVVAYRGAYINDFNRILEKSPIPTHVKHIILYVGINDAAQPDIPIVNSVCRLQQLLSLQRRFVHVVPVPTIEGVPDHIFVRINEINRWYGDAFCEAGKLIQLPGDFAPRRVQAGDFRHLHNDSALHLIDHIIGIISDASLN